MPTGRPSAAESQARTREFVRLVLEGCPFDEAARRARVKPMRALRLLTELDECGALGWRWPKHVVIEREQAA